MHAKKYEANPRFTNRGPLRWNFRFETPMAHVYWPPNMNAGSHSTCDSCQLDLFRAIDYLRRQRGLGAGPGRHLALHGHAQVPSAFWVRGQPID